MKAPRLFINTRRLVMLKVTSGVARPNLRWLAAGLLLAGMLVLALAFVTPAQAHHREGHGVPGGGDSKPWEGDVPANSIYIWDHKWWAGSGELSSVTIPAGTTVTWKNFDAMHEVEIYTGTPADHTGVGYSGKLRKGGEWSFPFTFPPGVYGFYCEMHNSMPHVSVTVNPLEP